MNTFKVEGIEYEVNDVMIGIPRMFRDEFIGAVFESREALGLCLAHADVAARAKIEGNWKFEDELKAMRVYLK